MMKSKTKQTASAFADDTFGAFDSDPSLDLDLDMEFTEAAGSFGDVEFGDNEDDEESVLESIAYTGDPEIDGKRELSETEKAFKADALRAQKQMDLVCDSEYWLCLIFKTREEVETFLTNSKWSASDEKYLDGRMVADKLGVAYKREDLPFPKTRINKTLLKLTMGVKKQNGN